MIKVLSIIEIAGFPEKHVAKTMKGVMKKLEENKEIKIIKKKIAKVKKVKELWSTFAELELDFKNFQDLTSFCFDYMPSSVEIVEPQDLNIKQVELSSMLNDVLAKLHQYQMFISNINAENVVLKRKLASISPSA